MKKTALLCVLFLLSLGAVRAQYAGFLGHKYVAGGYFSPGFDYIKESVSLHGGAHFTKSLNRYSALSTLFTYSLPFEGEYRTSDKDYTAKVNVVNIRFMYMRFRKKKGALAPIGLYNGFFADVDRVWAKGISSALPENVGYNKLWVGWEFGYNTCLADKLVANLSFDLRLPLLGGYNAFSEQVTFRSFALVKAGFGYLF